MGMAKGLGRRHVLTGTLAGGIAGAGQQSAQAAKRDQPVRLLPAKSLRVGDLVLGPQGKVVRLASVDRLATRRVRLRYTHPETGAATAFDPSTDRTGYPPRLRIVVLQRGVSAANVRLSSPQRAGQVVIDGGGP
jgi:hypothetical protein